MTSKVFAASVLALGLVLGAALAQAPRQPETFFKTKIGLSDSDIQKMGQSQVVTKVLPPNMESWFLAGSMLIPQSKSLAHPTGT